MLQHHQVFFLCLSVFSHYKKHKKEMTRPGDALVSTSALFRKQKTPLPLKRNRIKNNDWPKTRSCQWEGAKHLCFCCFPRTECSSVIAVTMERGRRWGLKVTVKVHWKEVTQLLWQKLLMSSFLALETIIPLLSSPLATFTVIHMGSEQQCVLALVCVP